MKGAVRANRRRKERSAMGAKHRDGMTKLGGDRGGGGGGGGRGGGGHKVNMRSIREQTPARS